MISNFSYLDWKMEYKIFHIIQTVIKKYNNNKGFVLKFHNFFFFK